MKKTKVPSKKEIEENFKNWKSAGPEKIKAVKARNELLRTEKKEAKFTARLTLADFNGFKKVAEDKGIPYQTLLGFVIHAYVEGRLVDVEEIRKVIPNLKIKGKAAN
jgi:Uncharacterized protein conserved in bacteria